MALAPVESETHRTRKTNRDLGEPPDECTTLGNHSSRLFILILYLLVKKPRWNSLSSCPKNTFTDGMETQRSKDAASLDILAPEYLN